MPFSKSTSIKLSQFSHFAVGSRKLPRQRYYSHVFYKLKLPHSEWDIFFVIIKEEPIFQKFVEIKYRKYFEGVEQIVKLKKGASSIKLKPNSNCVEPWKMTEMIASEIDIDDVDYFTPQRTFHVPHCHFNFCWNSHMPINPLYMKIDLEGADKPANFFHIKLPLKDVTTYSEDPINPDVLRKYHGEICDVLNSSNETLQSFAQKLFSRNIINRDTKISVIHIGGKKGADKLLDHIQMKVEQNPDSLHVVLQLMEKDEYLRYFAKKIKEKKTPFRDSPRQIFQIPPDPCRYLGFIIFTSVLIMAIIVGVFKLWIER